MSDNGRDRITFRLRTVDSDLREATKEIDANKLSELARDGLRLILGIRTTKRVEVTEKPIVEHRPKLETVREQSKPIIQGVGTVWKKDGRK